MFWIKFVGILTGAFFALGVLLMFTSARMWAIVPFLFAIILAAIYSRMITEYNAEQTKSTEQE